MALTNQEILVRVRAGLGHGRGPITNQDLNIIQSINAAMEDMAKLVDYEELRQNPVNITTVANQRYLDCSSLITAGSHQAWDRVDQVYNMSIVDGASSYVIRGLSPRQFERQFPIHEDVDTTGRPCWYTKRGQRIFFYPTPDAAYEIRTDYSIWPTAIQYTGSAIDAGSSPGQQDATCALAKSTNVVVIGAIYHAALISGQEEIQKKFFPIFNKQIDNDRDKNGPKIDVYSSVGGPGYAGNPKEATSPSAGAVAGTDSWDATYTDYVGWW